MYIWQVSVILSVVKCFIHFDIDMHQTENGCQVLLQRTAVALNEETMQMLLITT